MALALFRYPELAPPAAPRDTLDRRITMRSSAIFEFRSGAAWIAAVRARQPTEIVARDAELQGDFALANLVRLRAGRMFEDKGIACVLPGPTSLFRRIGDEYRYRCLFEMTFGTVHVVARTITGSGRIIGRFMWSHRNPLIVRRPNQGVRDAES